jgi:uncharacterized protein (TIGR02147 family)
MSKAKAHSTSKPRPDVFGYHDFRAFLKDWFAYLKAEDRDFSVRSLAEQTGFSSAYFPMVLKGERGMSAEALAQILPRLQLTRSEARHLENLVKLGTYESQEPKLEIMGRLSRNSAYQRRNPNEAELFRYASRWYHMAIRELATLQEFQSDPKWIQDCLKVKIPLRAIDEAISFLLEAGYLQKDKSGRISAASKETVRTEGTIFTGALAQAHKQMFSLATDSIEDTPPEERNLVGITVPLNSSHFAAARDILNRAINEIAALDQKPGQPASRENDNRIYQVELALFPLTKAKRDQENEK